MRPSKISRRSSDFDLCDRISNLPDSIISHILSCMPTKDAVRTCVLSKDWENKWNSVYNVDVRDTGSTRVLLPNVFLNFMDRVLLYSQDLRYFILYLSHSYESGRVESWISTALKRNVESLEIIYIQAAGVILPRSLVNGCSSLKSLVLVMPGIYKVHGKVQFQNLKSLYLDGVEIQNGNSSVDTVEFTFPVLKECTLKECNWLNVKFVKLYAPVLAYFMSVTQEDTEVSSYFIWVFGETPIALRTSGGLLENITVTPSPSYAMVENCSGTSDLQFSESGLQFRKLLHGLSGVRVLELTGYVVQAFARSKQGLPIPKYDKLDWLYVTSHCSAGELLDFLHVAPSLEYLVLHECNLYGTYDYGTVESVPSCILSQLKTVAFKNFSGSAPEFDLAKFILNNAAQLNKIYLSGENVTLDTVDRLAAVPKRSTCLSINIVPGSYC